MTPKQRARKIAEAKESLLRARRLLAEVHEDYAGNPLLSFAEREEWRGVVGLLGPLDRLAAETDV